MTYNPLQSLNAFTAGQQIGTGMRNAETQNAFGEMLGNNDLQGARDYAYGRGNLQLGQGADAMIAANQQQAQDADMQKAAQLKAFTENLLTLPEAQRGQYLMSNWPEVEPVVGTDFMTFWQASGGDVSDASLNEDLVMLRTKLGEAPPEVAGAEQFTLSPGQTRFDASGNPVASVEVEPETVDPRDVRVQSAFTGVDNQRYAIMSDGSVRALGVNERNPAQIVSIAGVPTAVDRLTTEQTPLTSIDQVAENKATLTEASDTASANVSAKADDRQARLSYARRAQMQLPKITAAREAVQRAKQMSGFANTGEVKLPFGRGPDLQGFLDTISANLSFEELTGMRRSSPTGAAVGNVTERELGLLSSTVANLSRDQREGTLDGNLDTIDEYLERLENAMRADAAYTVENSKLTTDLQAIDDEIAELEAALGGGQ